MSAPQSKITDAEVAELFERDARRQRRRARRGALRLLAARWLRVPWRCEACGCLVSARRIARHAKWHHSVALTAWAVSGGKGRKPQKPVVPKAFEGRG